jgi:hypothetical protein
MSAAAIVGHRPELTPAVRAALDVISTADRAGGAPAWTVLVDEQRRLTIMAMVTRGTGFDADLGDLCSRHPQHFDALAKAFPQIFQRFGPGSEAYQATVDRLAGQRWASDDGVAA